MLWRGWPLTSFKDSTVYTALVVSLGCPRAFSAVSVSHCSWRSHVESYGIEPVTVPMVGTFPTTGGLNPSHLDLGFSTLTTTIHCQEKETPPIRFESYTDLCVGGIESMVVWHCIHLANSRLTAGRLSSCTVASWANLQSQACLSSWGHPHNLHPQNTHATHDGPRGFVLLQ